MIITIATYIGQAMAVPVTRELKKHIGEDPDRIIILDAPPGTSCLVVETIRGADLVLMVTDERGWATGVWRTIAPSKAFPS